MKTRTQTQDAQDARNARRQDAAQVAQRAIDDLNRAASALRDAAHQMTWADGRGDFERYAQMIEELISTDNGDAGLVQLKQVLLYGHQS